MRVISVLKILAWGLLLLILASIVSAFAAGINVPPSNIGEQSAQVTAEDIKPPACQFLHLTNIVSGSGTLIGTAANDLIIGSAGADSIDGLGGDDCILGGNGDDIIIGNDGSDVCLGGTGTDSFTTCESEAQ